MSSAFDPAPTQLDAITDPAWLTAMCAARWPGARVTEVRIVETIVTQATKIRLALDIEGGPDSLPRNICVKGILTATGAPASASVVETLFYRDLANQVPVRVPPCIHAELNAAGDNGVIVMQDIIHDGATFLSALKPFTPDETRECLEQIALLHAATWQGKALYDQPWIPRFLDQIGSRPIMPLEALQAMLDGPKGDPLPAIIKDASRLQNGLQALAAQIRERPACLVHGDAHAGNIYIDAHGAYGLVDWQILQKGEWAQDVAYHIAAVLSPEDRRSHERALLDHYRDRLKALGGPDLRAEEAWTRYRAAMVYGYFLWTITQKVEPAITLEFVRRLGLAVADLESYAVLGV
jgi:aminoglycoside/choline kinase family phosphotransferase